MFIEVKLIYGIVLVSGIQQSDSVIHIYVCIYILLLFFLIIGYYKISFMLMNVKVI